MKFIAFGRTNWLSASIEACVARGHTAAAIVTAKPSPEYSVDEKDFQRLAKKLKTPFVSAKGALDASAVSKLIKSSGARVGISVNWPILIPAQVLDLFEKGIINAHAGDLPRFRGNACPNWAILSGEKRVVVSLHQMAPDLDSGPIHGQRSIPIAEDTYIGDIYRFMDENIPEMFVELLDNFDKGVSNPKVQSRRPEDILRCLPRTASDGHIDWTKPASDLHKLVRASAEPFAGAFTYLDGKRLTVWRARTAPLPHAMLGVPGQVVGISADGVAVLTGDRLLVLEEVQYPGKKRAKAPDVVRSTRTRLGLDLHNVRHQRHL